MAQSTYQLINLTASVSLNWPFSFASGLSVLDINEINANQSGWSITLPDARLATRGQNFIFNNVGGFVFEILGNDGLTDINIVSSGEIIQLYLIDSSTQNGVWRVIPYGSGTASITQFTAESTDSSIDITDGIVTPPTGIIDFKLPTSINNLNTLSSTGILVVSGLSPLTFKTVTLLSDTNLDITNPDGIAGDPVFNLSSSIGPLSQIEVGEMVLTGEVITNSTGGKNIQLSSSGAGFVQLNGVSIDANANISGINNLVPPKAFCVFTDTITGMSNAIIIQSQVNVASVTGGGGTYVITFITPMEDSDYAVFMNAATNDGPLPVVSVPQFLLREPTSVTITVKDTSQEFVLSAPNGISVAIMST